jgi:membrane-associated phospholipid phosphatase
MPPRRASTGEVRRARSCFIKALRGLLAHFCYGDWMQDASVTGDRMGRGRYARTGAASGRRLSPGRHTNMAAALTIYVYNDIPRPSPLRYAVHRSS